MRTIMVLLMKYVACVIAYAVGLDLFFAANIVEILSFSLFTTVASYLLGDMVILPQIGKRAALVVDFLLAYTMVWIFGNILLDNYMQIAWGSIISAFIIAGAEIFVHRYISHHASDFPFERASMKMGRNIAYSTEFAEEDIHDRDRK
ncbi:YndM family protein [Heyndrickxia ginsengihumi]|uniref:Membrane protein n=1 Tax=Heyndrickxia ginsengihumi TaxID=363870 RepID=A0A0A6VH51_9BACI|nr:YndM family protein [Heyndrickxia ginsengihumi]KHD86906.1 membrane protein [Heyndrickxia ginsengihumi]MBE6185408.1 DUF2512 family protein [Bacillus sp. (in: firmicutes)]MCM3021921.1 YndM family protein [Heyndrickxia ginsengihumi]NEY20393.1 YndM family protein [Heyndrickxia ginsengihumi]